MDNSQYQNSALEILQVLKNLSTPEKVSILSAFLAKICFESRDSDMINIALDNVQTIYTNLVNKELDHNQREN